MKIGKVKKLVAGLHHKIEFVVHTRNLKQALSYELVLKKVYRVITFNQSTWLKPYIDRNTGPRIKSKNDFEKDFFKLMKNSAFAWKC